MGTPTAPPPTEILTRPPAITYATEGVPPPAPLYVTVLDSIYLQAMSSLPNITFTLSYRLLLADGSIALGQQVLTPAANRSPVIQVSQLQEGFLLGVTCIISAVNPPRGSCWARVILVRGYPASQLFGQVLFSSNITAFDTPSWPPGYYEPIRSGQGNLRSITGTLPGAGAEISEVVPAGATWRLMSFRYSITTSVTVANRISHLVTDDGANVLTNVPPSLPATASTTFGYTWAPGYPATSGDSQIIAPIPIQYVLPTGYRIRTLTTGLQAADQYTAPQYEVEEWMGT